MLKRVSSSLFQGPVGSNVQIVARSRDNNGVNAAAFRYNQTDLRREMIQGLPGCSFVLLDDRRDFSALVVFDPGGRATARYDLFEVTEDGSLNDMSEDTFPSDDPDISFSIEGTAVARLAAAPRKVVLKKKAAKKALAKKKATKKKRGANKQGRP